MRALTAQQLAVLKCPTGYRTRARVKVRRADGVTWVDLSAFLGMDWTASISWDDTNENCVGGCTAEWFRGRARQSLSPWDASSVAVNGVGTLLVPGCLYTVEVCTIPTNAVPKSSDWVEAWRGYADMVEVEEERVRVTGRDLGGRLDDTFIEAEEQYGSDAGVAVQTVMQQILNRWGFSSVGLYTPVDPLWQLGPYIQKKEPVGESLRMLAQQLGWDVRYKWSDTAGGWRLTFWSPDRLKSAIDWSIPVNAVLSAPTINIDGTQCRNVVQVVYSDRFDREAGGNAKRKTVTSTDPSSVSTIGRRWMEIAEAASSNIDTQTEAQRLADAAIADLSLPCTIVEVKVRFSWHLQLGDLVQLPAFPGYNSAPLLGAVEKVAHKIDDGGEETSLTLRGQPAMNRDLWMQRECRPGYAPMIPLTGPAAPSGVTATPIVNGFAVSFTPAASGVPWASYELHVGTVSGFIPDTSVTSTTLKARSTTTRFEVTDLAAGTTYYARVLPLDRMRNYGPASDEAVVTGRYVEPRALQPRINVSALPMNSDFEAANAEGSPPDTWAMETGTWGVDAMLEGSSVFSGSTAIRLAKTAVAARIMSDFILIRGGDTITASAIVANEPPEVSGRSISIWLRFYDRHMAEVSTVLVATKEPVSLLAYGNLGLGRFVTAPSTASYVRVIVGKTNALANGTAYYALVDSVRLTLEPASSSPIPLFGGYVNGFDDWGDSSYEDPAYFRLTGNTVALVGLLKIANPAPSADSVAFTLPVGYRPRKSQVFACSTSGSATIRVTVDASGTVRIGSGMPAGGWVSLSGIRFAAT